MTLIGALEWTARLCGVLAVVQGAEFLFLRSVYAERGVWRWSDLKQELGGLHLFFGLFLKAEAFTLLNVLRIFVGLSLLLYQVNWVGAVLLLFFHFLTLIRWRGTFNGGSDYMNLLVLLCLSLGLYFKENHYVVMGALGYITLQLQISYFKAGYLKLKNAPWRKGLALREFVLSPIYSSTKLTRYLLKHQRILMVLSWLVILFELAFPMSLLGPSFATSFILMAFVFHLGNVYLFGLNRFLLSWVTAYPSLYFVSHYLQRSL